MAVERAAVEGVAAAVDQRVAVVAGTLAVHKSLVGGTDRVAEPALFNVSRLAETLPGVGVEVVAGVAVGADVVDAHVLGLADAGFGDVGVVLVDSGAGSDQTGLGVDLVGKSLGTLGTDALHDVVVLGALALVGVVVVDLVGTALHPADALVDVVELAVGALHAEVVHQEVTRLAHTTVKDEVLVGRTDRRTHPVAPLTV